MNGDLTPIDSETLESLHRLAGAENPEPALEGGNLKPLVLMVDDRAHNHAEIQALLARLDVEDLGHRVVLVSASSMVPAVSDITHAIQAMEERQRALDIHFRQEPAWLTEQHNRKPTPRKRRYPHA